MTSPSMTALGFRHRERGSALLELPFVLGLIVMPFALLVLQLPIWVQHQAAADDAAGEAARLVVAHGVDADTATLVAAIEASRGLPAGALHVEVESGGRPGDPVTARVVVDMPTITLPVFGVIGRSSWATSHTERVPDFGSNES